MISAKQRVYWCNLQCERAAKRGDVEGVLNYIRMATFWSRWL